MKILVFTTLFPNHIQPNSALFVMQRMRHFAKLPGCEIKVVAPVPYYPPGLSGSKLAPFRQIKKYEIIEGIAIYHPRFFLAPKLSMPFHGLSLFVASVILIRRIHKDFPFGLIDAHYIYPDGFAAVLLGAVLRKPVVLSARGSDINQFSGFRTIRTMLRFALKKAQRIISVCQALKQEMEKLGCDSGKIKVIPNGVDVSKFNILDKKKCRNLLEIPLQARVILSVGSLILRKGFDVLIRAMSIVHERRQDVILYILGDGAMKNALEALVKEKGLTGQINLVGEKPNEELGLWYNAADVFCLASSREGWANVIMEALACGCPVVATNVYGAPEIITSPKVGRLVEQSPKALAEGILDVLSTEWKRGSIRAHVASRDWMVVAREVEDVFKNCAPPEAKSKHQP